jgi:V/A-type H+-transporting ATPase subunit F
MKISVVGDFDTITGFRLAGIKDAYEVEEPAEAVETLKKLVKDEEIGLVIITERLADEIRKETEAIFEGRITPLMVEIPDKGGPIEKKVDPIKELIRRAVGVEIKF